MQYATQFQYITANPGAYGCPSPASMLRELAEVLDGLTRDRALVLVLEDLLWSEPPWWSG